MPPATVQEHAGKEKITRAVASGNKRRSWSGERKMARFKKEKKRRKRNIEGKIEIERER